MEKSPEIGGLGYDKSQDVPGRSEPTGIVLFPVRVVFDRVNQQLRQGTAIVRWQNVQDDELLASTDGIWVVPRAAARRDENGQWHVRFAGATATDFTLAGSNGTTFGIDALVVSAGLTGSDRVLVPGGSQAGGADD